MSYKIDIPLTRPAINRWGIPHKSAHFLLLGTVTFAMIFGKGSIVYYSAGIPFLIALRALCDWDHNFWRIFQLWRKTKYRGIMFNIHNGRPPFSGSLLISIPSGPRSISGAL